MLFPFSKIYHDGSFSSCVIPILVLSLRKKKKQWQKMYRFWHWSSLLSKMDVGLTRIYLVLRNCSSLYTSNQFPSPFLFLQERRSFFSFSFFFQRIYLTKTSEWISQKVVLAMTASIQKGSIVQTMMDKF